MNNLEKLEKLLSEATEGPWLDVSAFAAHDTVYPSINDYYITSVDVELICALRNAAPALIEVVRAARCARDYLIDSFSKEFIEAERQELRETNSCTAEFSMYLDFDKALQKLEEIEL